MSKLLTANFMRVKKDKFFWIGMIFMMAAGVIFPVNRYMDMKQTGFMNNIDNGFFGCALFIGILMAVFCSLFIGTEHSDGGKERKFICQTASPPLLWECCCAPRSFFRISV